LKVSKRFSDEFQLARTMLNEAVTRVAVGCDATVASFASFLRIFSSLPSSCLSSFALTSFGLASLRPRARASQPARAAEAPLLTSWLEASPESTSVVCLETVGPGESFLVVVDSFFVVARRSFRSVSLPVVDEWWGTALLPERD